MKSSKWIVVLLAVAVVFAMSTSSFAQVQLSIFNTPSAQEVSTSHNAQSADPTSAGSGILVSGAIVASSTLTTTTLTLTFPAPITAGGALDGTMGGGAGTLVPSGDSITIAGATGLFATVTGISTINYSAGTLVITLPGCGSSFTNGCTASGGNSVTSVSGSLRIIGVRLDVNGKTAPMTVSAALGNSANNYIPPSQTPALISATGAGFTLAAGAPSGVSQSSILMFTNNNTPIANKATFILNEGFPSAWRTSTQTSVSGTATKNGNNLALTIAGVPAGLTPSVSIYTPGVSTTLTPVATGFTQSTSTAGTWTGSISFTATSLTATESIPAYVVLTGTATGTLSTGNITLAASMGPTATSAYDSSGNPSGTNYPSFVSTASANTITIGSIASATTVLLVPYVVSVGSYDTGIAIANTTADPFGTASGGATPAPGTVTFALYSKQVTGGSIAVTSSSTNIFGQGFDTSGNIAAGTIWTGGLTSDILPAMKVTPPATGLFGYMFITTNFIDAHGAAYVYNNSTFTSASPMLVLPTPQSTPRTANEALNN